MRPQAPYPSEDEAPAGPAWAGLLPAQPVVLDESTTEVPVIRPVAGTSAPERAPTAPAAGDIADQSAEGTVELRQPTSAGDGTRDGQDHDRAPDPAADVPGGGQDAGGEAAGQSRPSGASPFGLPPGAVTAPAAPAAPAPTPPPTPVTGPRPHQPAPAPARVAAPESNGAAAQAPDRAETWPAPAETWPAPPEAVPARPEQRPGDVAEDLIAVWTEEAVASIREQWRDLQVQFIDDPDAAVRGARDLITDTVRTLSDRLLAERDTFDPHQGTDRPDTEAMRVAMRRYREFLDRVLAL
jgi:hypothetical protein